MIPQPWRRGRGLHSFWAHGIASRFVREDAPRQMQDRTQLFQEGV